jgi:hypothetical protein
MTEEATSAPDEAMPEEHLESAAEAGVVTNPEVPPAPEPPPAHPSMTAPSSPWARPAGGAAPTWDVSGYAPPAPIRIEPQPPAVFAPVGAGAYPSPPAAMYPPSALAVAPVAASQPKAADVPNRFRKIQLRTSLTLLLFIAGLAVGVVGLRMATPAHQGQLDSFPTLDRTAVEPIQSGAVAKELVQNDVHGLAQLLDGDTLTDIQTQLKPLVTFESVTFVGATSHDKDTLAGYVVRGRDQDGTLGLVGLVIRLRDGQVVAQ